MPTRIVYKNGRKITKKVDPKRSKIAKKAAKKRRGKKLSPAHRRSISLGIKKAKRRRKRR